MGCESGGAPKKLVAWTRWYLAADGPGPKHCGICQSARNRSGWCATCHNPPLLPENGPVVALYLAVETQWRYGGMAGVRTGLDYAGVRVAMDILRVADEDFPWLQVMERETMHVQSVELARKESERGR